MTTPDITAIRERAERAAEGPWFIRSRPTDDGLAVIEDGRSNGLFPITCEWQEAPHLAHSRIDIPALCDRVEKLEKLADGLATAGVKQTADKMALEAENGLLKRLLRELHVTVRGECPGLLDEDSGGNADLDLDIQAALNEKTAPPDGEKR